MSLPTPGQPPRVAYLVSRYPWPSHVFIEREIEGLRELGFHVETFSVRPTDADQLLSEAMRVEADQTLALLADRKALVRDAWSLVRTAPSGAFSALGRALGTGERNARARTWQLFYLAEAGRLHAEMRRRGLRHVHVHFSNNAADVARLVVALGEAQDGPSGGWSWSMTVHGPTEFEAVDRFDLAAKVRSAAAVACISDFTRSQLMRLVPADDWGKLHRVRMSVDIDRYAPPVAPREHSGPFRILNVGRLVPEKGAPVLIDAIADLRDRGVEVEAKIVGAGDLAPELADRANRAGLGSRVELLGAVGQDELPALYHWADVFCLPSFQEGLPVVLMEAMATGLPVVTTQIAGIPELVEDARTGYVVAAGRADLVADALERLSLDPSARVEFGRAGQQRIEQEFSRPVAAASQREFLLRML